MAKRIMREFTMSEISAVTVPAQKGARMAIMKRADPKNEEVAKLDKLAALLVKAMTDDKAESFNEAFLERKIDEQIWPMTSALSESVQSILRDTALDQAAKLAMIQQTAQEFVSAVQQWLPASMPSLVKALTAGDPGPTPDKGDILMPDNVKEIDTLKGQVGDLTKKLEEAVAKAMTAPHVEYIAAMPVEKRAAFLEMTGTDRDAYIKANPIQKGEDEVLKVGDATIRKSEVGAGVFSVMKAQQAQNDALVEKSEIAEFTKRAETELATLPGEPVAKGKALRALSKIGKEERETIEAMLKAGDAAMKSAFNTVGKDGAGAGSEPVEKLDALAKTYAAEHKVDFNTAYSKVLDTDEGRKLYAESRKTAN